MWTAKLVVGSKDPTTAKLIGLQFNRDFGNNAP